MGIQSKNTKMSDTSGPPTGPPILDTSQMRGGRIPRKKRNPSAKAADVPPIESEVDEPADEIDDADGQESQLTTIQILFGNANVDGSISDSAENLELLKKLWIEIERSSEFNIEEIKTMLNQEENSIAITALAVCIFNSKYSNVGGLDTSISKAERFLADRKIDFESLIEKLKL